MKGDIGPAGSYGPKGPQVLDSETIEIYIIYKILTCVVLRDILDL